MPLTGKIPLLMNKAAFTFDKREAFYKKLFSEKLFSLEVLFGKKRRLSNRCFLKKRIIIYEKHILTLWNIKVVYATKLRLSEKQKAFMHSIFSSSLLPE